MRMNHSIIRDRDPIENDQSSKKKCLVSKEWFNYRHLILISNYSFMWLDSFCFPFKTGVTLYAIYSPKLFLLV